MDGFGRRANILEKQRRWKIYCESRFLKLFQTILSVFLNTLNSFKSFRWHGLVAVPRSKHCGKKNLYDCYNASTQ